MNPDYLLLGHFTCDVLPDGSTTLGGTSLYASLTADRLGQQVAVVSAPVELPPSWPTTISVAFHSSPTPPTFENRYTHHGREQILHAIAQPITIEAIPPAWRFAPIVHLGPVLGEIPEAFAHLFPQALLGVTPQGWMRVWDTLPGLIRYQPWRPSLALLRRIDVLILSIEDVKGDEALVVDYARHCRLVALTRGPFGATLFVHGEPVQIDAFPAVELDPTGAGDVFAAALLVRFYETNDPVGSAYFAACVAARSVEGMGPSCIPTRVEAEARWGIPRYMSRPEFKD